MVSGVFKSLSMFLFQLELIENLLVMKLGFLKMSEFVFAYMWRVGQGLHN